MYSLEMFNHHLTLIVHHYVHGDPTPQILSPPLMWGLGEGILGRGLIGERVWRKGRLNKGWVYKWGEGLNKKGGLDLLHHKSMVNIGGLF
jgi:hypothetical protein